MLIVICGGSGSGKSEFAESLAVSLEPKEKIYLATMDVCDEESVRRREKHRRQRRGRHFRTIECPCRLETVRTTRADTVLLESLSNLVAGEMFRPEGCGGERADPITEELFRLRDSCRNLIVVTDDVFGDGTEVGESSRRYMEILGETARALSASADRLYRVVCGIPIRLR